MLIILVIYTQHWFEKENMTVVENQPGYVIGVTSKGIAQNIRHDR